MRSVIETEAWLGGVDLGLEQGSITISLNRSPTVFRIRLWYVWSTIDNPEMVVQENGLRAVNIFGHSSKSLWYCEHVTICFERVCPYQIRVAVVEKKFFYFWMYWKFLVGEFVV